MPSAHWIIQWKFILHSHPSPVSGDPGGAVSTTSFIFPPSQHLSLDSALLCFLWALCIQSIEGQEKTKSHGRLPGSDEHPWPSATGPHLVAGEGRKHPPALHFKRRCSRFRQHPASPCYTNTLLNLIVHFSGMNRKRILMLGGFLQKSMPSRQTDEEN